METKNVKISAQFGHEIAAVNFAKAFNLEVVIIPNKDNKEDYEKEAETILNNMSFFYDRITIVPFEEKEAANASAWDIIGDLKAGTLDDDLWNNFATSRLVPSNLENLPAYNGLANRENVLVIPQKLISDGECGITAKQQSLPLEAFEFLNACPQNFVLGQHFHKINDRPAVEALAQRFEMYVPGMTENPEVFGIRGVQHRMYYNMYASLKASVGIAGTHTWLLLTMFPDIPQLILFNKKGVERWKAIEAAYQKQGYNIICLGFDENTDMAEFAKEIETNYAKLFA